MSAWSIEAALGVTTPAVSTSGSTTAMCEVRDTPQLPSAKAFLLSKPNGGVYTCARASAIRNHHQHYELVLGDFHLERLATGIRTLCSNSERNNEKEWVADMQRVTTELSEKVIRHAEAQREQNQLDDLMVTVLWWTNQQPTATPKSYNVSVHACLMPTPKSMTSTILIHGEGRENALCKHTKWISARAPLEEYTAQMNASHGPIHETILSSYDAVQDDKLLLEGLITNFFVVQDGNVATAADGVLRGSTRELVLKACKELGIPVVFRAPRLSEKELWQAAFVTSAVRVVIGVTRVLWKSRDSDNIQEFQIAESSDIVERMRQCIIDRQYFLSQ